MTFEQWLAAAGIDLDAQSEGDRYVLKAMFEEEQAKQQKQNEPAGDDGQKKKPDASAVTFDVKAELEAARKQQAAESQRIADVRRICADAGGPTLKVEDKTISIEAHAIAEGWDSTRTELECLRAARPAPNVIARSHDNDCTREALAGALILRQGGQLDNRHYASLQGRALAPEWLRRPLNDDRRNQLMENAWRYRDYSLVDLCREAVRIDGRDVPHSRKELIASAVSGSALTNIFTDSVNAMVLASYMESGDTTMGWTRSADVGDYKTQERPRVNVGGGLQKRPRGHSAQHHDYADVLESYKIASYAGQFVVDSMDIIDDRFGALDESPDRLGEAAGWLRPDLVYSILLANANLDATSTALFHADQDQGTGNGNLDTGSALSETTLRTGVSRMLLFQENSRNLNIRPTHLLVPPTLLWTARELVESTNIVYGADDETARGSKNVLQAVAIPVADARLENGVTDPNTGTVHAGANNDWYLASTMAHTIEVGYLRGTGRAPQVRSWTYNSEGKYGVGWDIELSIGAKALDWRGLYKGEG